MCLYTIIPEKEKRETLSKKSTWIKVYKVVCKSEDNSNFSLLNSKYWVTGDLLFILKAGLNKPDRPDHYRNVGSDIMNGPKYLPLFHSWYTLNGAKTWVFRHSENPEYIITCYVKKGWITKMGRQHDNMVVVSNAIIAPEYPNKELTDEEKLKYGIK